MRRANGLALAGMLLAATACDDGRLASELQGRVYDVRLLAEPSPATRIPGGTVAVTAAGDVVSDVTVSAVRLPGGPAAEYSAYLLDERTGNAGARVTFAPDELGEGTVTLSDLGEATTVVIAAGAQAPGALWARFRDLSTGAIAPSADLVLGHFEAEPQPFPYAVAGTGRIGLYERGEFGSNDFRLGGVIENLAVAPPGFTYVAWLHDAERDVWVRLGPPLDESRNVATGLDALPPAGQPRHLAKLYLDVEASAQLDFRYYTHVRLSLERADHMPDAPLTTVFAGTFGAQFLLRRPEEPTGG
jgi:hypothetical protein